MNSIFGGLFEFEDTTKLEDFVESIDKEKALTVLQLAIEHTQQNGFYTMEESYVLYKVLNKIKEK